MKQVRGIWLPDGETHLVPFLESGPLFEGRATYQLHKLDAALKYVDLFGNAVDVGAHVGTWSRILAAQFTHLWAFEPVAEHRECWRANMEGVANADLHAEALSDADGALAIRSEPGSSGDSYVTGSGSVPARTLDSFDLPYVDFLKIDTEGYELFVVRGGEATIRRSRPVMVIEQKPGKGARYGLGDMDAVALVQSWGAKIRTVISGDFILSWD